MAPLHHALSAFALTALLAAGAPVRAQATAADSVAIVTVTQRLFDAMAAGDSTALRDVLHPAAQLISVGPDGDVQGGAADGWVRAVGRSGGVGRERVWAPRVEADGDIATLWARYDFHIGERLSHCGTDAFQFVRDPAGRWRILVVTFSVETTGCEPGAQP